MIKPLYRRNNRASGTASPQTDPISYNCSVKTVGWKIESVMNWHDFFRHLGTKRNGNGSEAEWEQLHMTLWLLIFVSFFCRPEWRASALVPQSFLGICPRFTRHAVHRSAHNGANELNQSPVAFRGSELILTSSPDPDLPPHSSAVVSPPQEWNAPCSWMHTFIHLHVH